jgi:hypothetical protein
MSEPTYDEVMRENQDRWVEYLMNWLVIMLNEKEAAATPACWFMIGPSKAHIVGGLVRADFAGQIK